MSPRRLREYPGYWRHRRRELDRWVEEVNSMPDREEGQFGGHVAVKHDVITLPPFRALLALLGGAEFEFQPFSRPTHG